MTETLNYLNIPSKLPEIGTTIFSVMSTLAEENKAVNLGQGFPDFSCDPALIQAVNNAMHQGHNQYSPMQGMPVLREAITHKISALYGHNYDSATELTVTAGATQAILTAVLAIAHSRFTLLPSAGTYFQCVNYSAISDVPEFEFAQWLTTEIGVAAIPVSTFYHQNINSNIVRFCFAKQEQTLTLALKRLTAI